MREYSFCDDGLVLLASIEESFHPFADKDVASMLLYEEQKKEAREAWIQHRRSCSRCLFAPARYKFLSTLSILTEAERSRMELLSSPIRAQKND